MNRIARLVARPAPALLAGVVGILVLSIAVTPASASAGTLSAVALPSTNGTQWNAVNASDQVAGSYIYPGAIHPTAVRWQDGTLTALPIPSNSTLIGTPNASAGAIDAAGGLFGGYTGADAAVTTRAYPVVWSPSLAVSSPATGPYNGNNGSSISPSATAASANGNTAGWWCGNNGSSYTPCAYYYALAPTGSQTAYQFVSLSTPTLVGTDGRIAINDAGALAIGYGSQSYLYPHGPTGAMEPAGIQLAGTPRDINDNGDVIGETGGLPAIELANGTVKTLPVLRPGDTARPTAINDGGEVVGNECLSTTCTPVAWIGGKVTALKSMLPAGFTGTLQFAVDVNNHGSILVSSNSGTGTAYLLKAEEGARVIGSILRGSRVGVPDRPARPVAGDVVAVTGRTSAGAAFSGTATTDATGAYAVTAPAGSYTVTFPNGVCVTGPAVCTRSRAVTVKGSDVRVDGIAVSSTLSVKVTLSKSSLQLVLGKNEKLEPKTIGVTVRIKNTGQRTVAGVTPQKPLYSAVGGAKVAKVPLKLLSGPTPAKGRDLKPGATIEAKYELRVSGDGKYDVEVLAVGGIAGVGRVTGVGSDRLTVGAPVLVVTSEFGRKVRSPDAPALIRAGTVFTVKLKLRNISYTHDLGIYPMKPDLEGNASDGHVDIAGRPIQNPSLTAPPEPSVAIVLGPRQTREMEIVVRTTATYADVQSPEFPGGGTHAVVHVPDPRVADLNPDESVKGEIPARDIHVKGEKEYRVGIDDRDFRDPPPEQNFPAKVAYFSVGVFQGVWNLTGGVAVAVFKDLPLLLAKGVIGAPSALASYAQLEAELWDSIKGDPVKVAAFLNIVSNTALLAYRHAPALAGNTTEFVKKVDQQVLEHYTRLANDESSGNLYAAIQEYGKEGTEITGNLVLASGILTRLPAAAEALNAIKQASYVKVGETLNVIADGVGAREALAALKQAVPGYEFLTADLRKFYGLSENQVAYLRGFAKENKLIITLRSRAEESIKWLNEGAVLKPEQIKIKTVSIDDINYLGYRKGDLGRVVIRRPPSQAELARSLRADGIGPQDPEWATAFRRLKDRTTEWNHPAYDQGYVKYLEDGSTNEELALRWNLQHNSVDAGVLPNGYTKYGMRLLDEGGGNRVLQFCVDTPPCRAGSPGWRSVTGDVDFLSIVHADGSPLSALERIAVYRQMAKSPVGMLHPAADTWTLVKRGGQQNFDFAVKTNEFVRGGTAAQFGPDGVARAVTFNPASRFTGPTTYRIFWNGGYVNVKRLLFR
jgi:hypothetical protein